MLRWIIKSYSAKTLIPQALVDIQGSSQCVEQQWHHFSIIIHVIIAGCHTEVKKKHKEKISESEVISELELAWPGKPS